MFKRFRAKPSKKLEREYARILEQARDAQRRGEIPLYATLSAKAEDVLRRLDALNEE